MSAASMPERDVDIDLRQLFASLLRNWLAIAVFVGICMAVALAYLVSATPLYRAETRILIEARESVFTRPVQDADRPILDEEGVTSQVQVISSVDLLRDVARSLDLAGREEFNPRSGSLRRALMAMVGLAGAEPSSEERVLRAMRERLTVYRVERSRVIVVEFASEDPELAANAANAIADAYIVVQRDAKQLSTADATRWLEPEIETLRQRVREAEAKVADFRAKSDLMMGQNNSTLATQQLAEMSTELSRVRAARAAAEANAEGVRAALSSGASLESIPEVLGSGLIQRLREREVQLRADIADLSTTLLDNHPRIRSLRSQLADLEGQIRGEARKLLGGLENEARSAQLREQQLSADLNRLKVESARADEETVELRSLEREAASQRALLESYLTRYREAASRGESNYAPVDARVFSRAIEPSQPYFPRPIPILSAAFAGSLLLAALAVLMAELFSGRAMRPARSVGADSPVPIVHAVAPARAAGLRGWLRRPSRDEAGEDAIHAAVAADIGAFHEPVADLSVEAAADMLIAKGKVRAIVVSPEGDEGVASAVLIARAVSDAGLRVILVDLTLSGATARPMLDGEERPGVTDLLAARAQFRDVIHGDLYSGSDLMPTGTADAATAMRAIDRLPMILDSLSTAYDVVIAECGAADAASLSRLAGEGSVVFVSILGADGDTVEALRAELASAGYADAVTVSPEASLPPSSPVPDRSAA